MADDDFPGYREFANEEYADYYERSEAAGYDMFDRIAGTEFLDADERAEAFVLFYEGFAESGGDRDAFLDYMGIDAADFPWEDWAEWMGYE